MAAASLPKRALSASATLPAGTISVGAFGVARWGAAGGHRGGAVSAPLGPKASPRVIGAGEIRLTDGDAEYNEFWRGACPHAAPGVSKERMSASPGHRRPRMAAFAGALLMTMAFSD
jgi:hypothetical protein